jgi:hypothetical protein
MMMRTYLAVLATVAIAACGKDATGPSAPTYNNIAATYTGALAGTASGIALQAVFSTTLTQNSANLSGSYGMTGTLSDGINVVAISGTGTLSGTVASGNNPSVNVTLRIPGCPSYSAQFSGAYDTANSILTISGPVDVLNNDCSLFIRYQSVIVLRR